MTTSMNDFFKERRSHERLPSEAVISYCLFEELPLSTDSRQGKLCDFSGGGVRFLATESFTKGTQLVLELTFKGWRTAGRDWLWTGNNSDTGTLKALGAVMWCAPTQDNEQFELGVRFTGRLHDQGRQEAKQ
ncbi:PilZ domain-containing protein [Desulfobacterota bacterium M19]